MKKYFLTLAAFLCFGCLTLNAQDQPAHPSFIGTGTFTGISKPLRDLPTISNEEFQNMLSKAESRERNEELRYRSYPFESIALPKGQDPVWQQTMGNMDLPAAPLVNFNGQDSPYYPPDCNGTAGPNHYMQTINCVYAIYNKTGTIVAGPTNMNLLFNGVPGANYNDGDPIILYDEQADRWLATEFSITGSTDYVLMAVSTTNDPTGTWYTYSFVVDAMPDYPKFSVWRDGYYMGDNNSSTKDIYVFERSQMLIGQTAQYVGFNNPNRPASSDGFMCVPPVDNDGTFAPIGSPGLFIAFNDDAFGGGTDQLWIYELAVNWTSPASSTFVRSQQLTVPPFDSNFGSTWENIPQPGTSQKLDAIPQVIMNVPQYRNFGSYQTIVCCHTVDVDATNHAGIRWYELRRTTGTWSLRQSGTYAPDAAHRWMGSIMLNGNGKIGLGYSISSTTIYPGIRYCGQSASAYNTGAGVLDIPEEVIQTGANSQTGIERWGDYSLLAVDPVDDQTFWFTTQYIGSGGTRKTKIASFKFGNNPTVITQDATAVTSTSATLNGTVNPNGFSTTYHFEWGTTTSYGNNTTSASAGSGTGDVPVSANISGLTSGITYHFRLVASNTDGPTNGIDKSFTPGAASVTTTAATGISANTATTGGNVITDGGSAVSARGVCWGTSLNPDISGNHTTDGSGTGTFISTLSGLSASTTYHIRAYATNGNGTFYGDDLQFTTSCGIVSTLPFTEGFETSATRPNCWTEDNTNPAWQFIAGNGGSNPSAAHTGVRDACLKDNSAASNLNKLITPVMNLSGYTNVQLTFWLFMQSWSGDQDELTVYYRTSLTGSWISLQNYNTSITTWSQKTIALNTTSAEFQVAFEGNAKYGYGVCIDDISITGTALATLSVAPANQNVTPPAGTTDFTVTCSTTWTAVSDATAWCTVTPSGSGNGTIVATYAENTTASQRIANITVSAPSATPQMVTVTQSGVAPTLSVVPSNQNVTSPAGSTSFTVTSNASWTVTSDASWCTPTLSGSGNGTIAANYTENPATTTRIASLTVTVSGLPAQVVTVTQEGAVPTLVVTPPNREVTQFAGSTDFTVTSNSSWTAASDASWCTVTPSGTGNGTIVADYSANPNNTIRVASITVSVPGITPVPVTVTQAPLVSLEEPGLNGIRIYPNPSKGVFNITTESGEIFAIKVKVQNLSGKDILRKSFKGAREYQLDLSAAAEGTYNIIIYTDEQVLVRKLVVLK